MITAAEQFEHFVTIIEQAWKDKNIYSVPEAAEAAGFKGGEVQRGLSQRWEYGFTDESGVEVEVTARWWDQSKAFSIQPDMHVMNVSLKTDPPKHFERRYEE